MLLLLVYQKKFTDIIMLKRNINDLLKYFNVNNILSDKKR